MSTQATVPVGPTTLAGWGTAATAFAVAVIAYLTGDHTAQTITSVEAAGLGVISLTVTQVGRYVQAKKLPIVASVETDAKKVVAVTTKADPQLITELKTFLQAEIQKAIKAPAVTDAEEMDSPPPGPLTVADSTRPQAALIPDAPAPAATTGPA